MFYHNYVDQCNRKGMSPSAAAEAMGFKRSVVTRWAIGTKPRQATLQRIADFFGCSVNELIKNPATENGDGMKESDEAILNFMRSLPKEKLQGILVALGAPQDVLDSLDH